MEYLNEILNNALILWLTAGFALATLIQLIYFWGVFSRLAFHKNNTVPGNYPPVSMVITSNNQFSDLRENLQNFVSQDYPEYEVLVVVDNSDDGTDEFLKDFSRQSTKLHVVELKQKLNWFSGRKFALSLGIKSAKHEVIVLTDPTCRPASGTWLKEIINTRQGDDKIVMGYAGFRTKSSINKWLRFTAFYDALFYLSMALGGKPFKASGKNLSYSKSMFFASKGFSSHYAINAGDDELFVNKTASGKNTVVAVTPDSHMNQVKQISFGKWFSNEKIRLKIRQHFKFRDRLVLRLFALTSFLFYALFIALLIFKAPLVIVLAIFALRLISQMTVFGLAMKKLAEKNLWLISPIFELFLVLADFFIWISILLGRKNKWG